MNPPALTVGLTRIFLPAGQHRVSQDLVDAREACFEVVLREVVSIENKATTIPTGQVTSAQIWSDKGAGLRLNLKEFFSGRCVE
jgi:hypothetical protein